MKRSIIFSLIMVVGIFLNSITTQGQSVSNLTVSYVLNLPKEGLEGQKNELQIQALFAIQGHTQLGAIEVMIGSSAGKEEGGKFIFQVVEKSGSYYLEGGTGSFIVLNGVASVIIPVMDQQKMKYVTLHGVSLAGIKTADVFGVLN